VAVQLGVLGASKQVAMLGEGEFFGEMSLMTGALRTATVVAKTDVECYVVDKEAFQEIVQEKPDLAGTISDILSRRQVDLGVKRMQTPVPSAAQTNQLRSKIAAFFGLGGGKPRS
jgi:CRP-like cAMP-binding protein